MPHIARSMQTNEPRCEKTCIRTFRPGPTQTGLYSHRRWLEAGNFGFRKKRDCSIYVAKAKALISYVVTTQLICGFVFAYAKSRFSHDPAQIAKHSQCIKSSSCCSKIHKNTRIVCFFLDFFTNKILLRFSQSKYLKFNGNVVYQPFIEL